MEYGDGAPPTTDEMDATTGDATSGETDAAGDGDGDADAREAEAAVPDPCAGLAMCDDFESTPPGQPPQARLWSVGGPNCGATVSRGTATIDSTRAHGGVHSVKVVNDFGADAAPPDYCDHVFLNNVSAFTNLGPQIYARFFAYFGDSLDPTSHTTFVTMTDQGDTGQQLRVGVGNDVFVWNRESDDAFLPELDTGMKAINTQGDGVVQPTIDQWFCLEFHIDQNAGTIDTWIDDAEVPSLVETGTPVANVSAVWLSGTYAMWRPQITSFGLGWETYFNSSTDSMTLWFDDVAIASHRIGCTSADQ